MWPFYGAKKSETRHVSESSHHASVETTTERRNLQNLLEYKREDVNLQLSPDRVRTLKKILYYHSTLSTTKRDYDIFAVSWDVNNLPEPPDDISPLLPPDSWGEPDMIAIGLQRCPASAAPLWSVIIAHSVHQYSPLFKPVSTEAPFDERSGNLIVLFMRQDLLQYVSGYSSKLVGASPANAAALRFSFHQSSIAFVCARLMEEQPEGFSIIDPLAGLDKDDISQLSDTDLEKLHSRMASEALLRQKFATMVNCLHFDVDGRIVTINEHPIVVWMGLKDYVQKSQREEKMTNAIFLNSKRDVANIPPTLDPTNPFAALESHSFDIRAVKKVLLGPPSCHAFGTFANLLCRATKGRVDILKAGIMRLVLELVDDSGVPTPRESSPELVFIRATIPTVDPNLLRDVYLKSWRILRNVDAGELPQIKLEPTVLRIPKPLAPWTPFTFSFKIINVSENKLPAPFTIFCVSDSGSFVLPLGRHSFLHQSKTLPRQRKKPSRQIEAQDPNVPADGPPLSSRSNEARKARGREGQLLPTGQAMTPLLSPAEIQKKVGVLKKLAGRNLGHSWLVRTARGAAAKGTASARKPSAIDKEPADAAANLSANRLSTIQAKNSAGNKTSRSILAGFLPPKYKKAKSGLKENVPNTAYSTPELDSNENSKIGSGEIAIGSEGGKESIASIPPAPLCNTGATTSSTPPTMVPNSPRASVADRESVANLPEFTLTKWMLVEPLEGVVLYGKEVEVQVTILIQEGFLEPLEMPEPITLVVRVDDCSRDFFLGVEVPRVVPALDGLGPNQLQEMGSQPLKVCQEGPDDLPPSADRQRNYLASASPPTASARRRSFLSPPRTNLTQPTALPMPKEIWHILTFVHQRIVYELDESNAALPSSWSSDEDSAWFCFPLFLQKASRGWETAAPRIRQDLNVVRKCIETHQQIPASVSIEAALRTLERWAMSLPVPLVPREYITDISQDGEEPPEGHVHFVCRAVLLSLPMVARNILLSLTSLIRELLVFHYLTAQAMLRPLIETTLNAPANPCPSLRSILSREERSKILQSLMAAKFNGGDDSARPTTSGEMPPKMNDNQSQVLVAAVSEWVARFILRDTPAALSLPFIRHFIKMA